MGAEKLMDSQHSVWLGGRVVRGRICDQQVVGSNPSCPAVE